MPSVLPREKEKKPEALMRPGFEQAKKVKPSIVVICTDGLVGDGWPSEDDCRRIRVLAAVVGGGAEVPPHIGHVEID